MDERTIHLGEDETAIVGYGSLLSPSSIGRTLGKKYRGPFIACCIEGRRRTWDASMRNEAFYFMENGERVYPDKILYLNAPDAPGAVMNCVVFVLTSSELNVMEDREWIYDRTIVTEHLRGLRITGGEAILFTARDECMTRNAATPREAAVRASYLRLLQKALDDVPSAFRAEFERTTDDAPAHLVIEDALDPDRPNPWENAGHAYRPESHL